jgi:hypothetical protein
MEAALAVLGIQGVLGAYDNFRNHEFHEGLPHKSHQRFELLLHAAREAFYLVLFPTMAWMEWRGWLAYVFGTVIVGEIVITCWDFVEEDRTRKLSANERVLHTILTLNYGAFLALLAPVLVVWAGRPTELAFVDRGFWSWLMTIYSLGVLIFAIRELSSGLAMLRQSRSAALDSPHARALDVAGVHLPGVLRGFYDGSGIRTAQGLASVTVGRGLAGILLKFMGLEMRSGRQNLVVSFEPDGQGELWQRTFDTGRFTSRFETGGSSSKAVVELFGPFTLCYDLIVGADDITWALRRVRLFGVPLPAAMAPRVVAREWISVTGTYEMSASMTMPLLGHLLSYTGTLVRTPGPLMLAAAT